MAEEEAYELFCEEGLCPFDLLKYGMEHDLLPEAQFPSRTGKSCCTKTGTLLPAGFWASITKENDTLLSYANQKSNNPFAGKAKPAAGKRKGRETDR